MRCPVMGWALSKRGGKEVNLWRPNKPRRLAQPGEAQASKGFECRSGLKPEARILLMPQAQRHRFETLAVHSNPQQNPPGSPPNFPAYRLKSNALVRSLAAASRGPSGRRSHRVSMNFRIEVVS